MDISLEISKAILVHHNYEVGMKKLLAASLPMIMLLPACTCGSGSDAGTDMGMNPGTDTGVDSTTPDSGPDAAAGSDAAATDAGSLGCVTTEMSDLAGVRIEFPDQQCVFTLAQAAAGITIDYDVIVEMTVDNVIPEPQDFGTCDMPGPSGLILFERLMGGGENYCVCDSGLCLPPPILPVQLLPATYPATFTWMGRNWMGPSDTGNPMGAAFPEGTYTLRASAIGTRNGVAFTAEATFLVHLVP